MGDEKKPDDLALVVLGYGIDPTPRGEQWWFDRGAYTAEDAVAEWGMARVAQTIPDKVTFEIKTEPRPDRDEMPLAIGPRSAMISAITPSTVSS